MMPQALSEREPPVRTACGRASQTQAQRWSVCSQVGPSDAVSSSRTTSRGRSYSVSICVPGFNPIFSDLPDIRISVTAHRFRIRPSANDPLLFHPQRRGFSIRACEGRFRGGRWASVCRSASDWSPHHKCRPDGRFRWGPRLDRSQSLHRLDGNFQNLIEL